MARSEGNVWRLVWIGQAHPIRRLKSLDRLYSLSGRPTAVRSLGTSLKANRQATQQAHSAVDRPSSPSILEGPVLQQAGPTPHPPRLAPSVSAHLLEGPDADIDMVHITAAPDEEGGGGGGRSVKR